VTVKRRNGSKNISRASNEKKKHLNQADSRKKKKDSRRRGEGEGEGEGKRIIFDVAER
jgi:hypothetical protein